MVSRIFYHSAETVAMLSFALLLLCMFAFATILLISKDKRRDSKAPITEPQRRVHRLNAQVDVLLETLGLKPDEALPSDVANLIHAGRKIEAIKRYRELTGVDLKEAKDAVEGREDLAAVERKLDRVLQELGVNLSVAEAPSAVKDAPTALTEIEQLVAAGQIIPAVKQYKETTGSSLLEAKIAVQQIQRQQQDR
jgi:ribosomal protein L7/L12